MDENVASVREKLWERAETGQKKYGVPTTRPEQFTDEWLIQLQEELMDACVYIEAYLNRSQNG
jgi:hypothetical protein